MPVFDAVEITSGDLSVTVARTAGPLETGSYDPATGDWEPVDTVTHVDAPGFGSDSDGPYFQPGGADPGDSATLFLSPDGSAWVG